MYISCSMLSSEKTRIWLEQPDMQVWILTLALVSLLPFCSCLYLFLYINYFYLHLTLFFLMWCLLLRTKSKGWLRIAGICSYVLLKREVYFNYFVCLISFSIIDMHSPTPKSIVCLGRGWKQAPRNRSMKKSVKRKFRPPLR